MFSAGQGTHFFLSSIEYSGFDKCMHTPRRQTRCNFLAKYQSTLKDLNALYNGTN